MKAAVGRADLAWILGALPPAAAARAAAMIGFEAPVERRELPAPPVEVLPARPIEVPRAGERAPVPFWRLEELKFTADPPPQPRAVVSRPGLTSDDLRSPGRSLFATPAAPSLARWSRLWPSLLGMLQAQVPGRDPDVPAIVRALGRGEVLRDVPRVQRKAWAGRASVWVDRSARLVPFWSDQDEVCRRLRKVCGRSGLDVRGLSGRAQARQVARRGDLLEGRRQDPMVPVLVLGDLGVYGTDGDRAAWLRTARRLDKGRVRIRALVPCPPARWDKRVARAWGAAAWERGQQRGVPEHGRERHWEERAERLLSLASAAALVQPGLLRALRRLLPGWQADAASEADAWTHADVKAADATGLLLRAEAAQRLREGFAKDADKDLKEQVSRTIKAWHEGLPEELLLGETVVWRMTAPDADAPGDVARANAFVERLAVSAGSRDAGVGAATRHFGRAFLPGLPAAAYVDAAVGRNLQTLFGASYEGVSGVEIPAGIDPPDLYREVDKPAAATGWGVRQVGDRLVFSPLPPSGAWPSEDMGPGSPVAWIWAALPHVYVARGEQVGWTQLSLEDGLSVPLAPGEALRLKTDRCVATLRIWKREPWASAAGRDRFGLWANAEVNGVVQRFRWIPPGRSWMGSSEAEAGRLRWEGPRHMVIWADGRWLGDTPVTQDLWMASMDKNPSRFQTPNRPVEQVSWDECRQFAEKLGARLPTEAEWEHACRAGTATATWMGDLDILGDNNAPRLDPIAWYGGNSGHEFDLDDGHDSSGWQEKQYPHTKAGTRPVGQKDPNPFGLYDVLGNVWEWCEDTFAAYDGAAPGDVPDFLTKGGLRVLRGGSCSVTARVVRAACRDAGVPGSRDDYLGFRLARGRAPDPVPGAERSLRGAERSLGTRSGPNIREVAAPARDETAPPPKRKKKKR